MAPTPKRRVLVIGGGFSGLLVARDMGKKYDVTVVDAKEFFEYTPGILRAYVKPCHFDALTFTLQDVIEHKMGCKFIWGEVLSLNGSSLTATVRPMCTETTEELGFDYCVICSGCNFNFLHPQGESLFPTVHECGRQNSGWKTALVRGGVLPTALALVQCGGQSRTPAGRQHSPSCSAVGSLRFPTVHECGRQNSGWKHIDERYLEGRRRHILEENAKIAALAKKEATILICGAGFIGVEWATELQYFYPKLKITIIDFLPNCLGPLPVKAQEYCDKYMAKVGIKTVYGVKYDPKSSEFWQKVGLPNGADESYICMGVKASNYFMPKETLSDKGSYCPGGGGWIYMNKKLQVTTASGEVWGKGVVFAAGDCNYGCVGSPSNWELHPIPKISYPSEEQATQICK
eukprot:g20007.t1